MADQVLSLDQFNQLPDTDTVPVSQKPVLSLADFEHLGSAEDEIRLGGAPTERFGLEKALFHTMTKGSEDFYKNMAESFKYGDESAKIDMLGFSALNGELDYGLDVKPVRMEFAKRMQEKPIKGDTIISDAVYSVAGMLPAMGRGYLEGAGIGAATAVGTAAIGGFSPPALAAALPAYAAASTVGSMNYWYKQGAGSLYMDLKDNEIDDGIAVPVSHLAGALYGAIEFAQVDKLIPGSKAVAKEAITRSAKRAISELVLKYGANWAQEVGEEGMQEVVMQIARDVSANVAGKANKTIGAIIEKALTSGWNASKQSAIPMMLLLSPSAAVDSKRVYDDQKMIEQAEKIVSDAQKEANQEKPADLDSEAADAVDEALNATEEGDAEEPAGDLPAEMAAEEEPAINDKSPDEHIADLENARAFIEEDTALFDDTEKAARIKAIDDKIAKLKSGEVKFSRQTDITKTPNATFFSQLDRVIQEKMPNSASPEQVMGILNNSGVKKEERDWLDIEGFLSNPNQNKQKFYRAAGSPEIAIRAKDEPFFFLALDHSLADDFAHGGKFARPGAKVYEFIADDLKIKDPRKSGQKVMTWQELAALQKNQDVAAELQNEGYDAILIDEGGGRLAVAVMPHALNKIKQAEDNKISKQELLDFIRTNDVKVEEVVKGRGGEPYFAVFNSEGDLVDELEDRGEAEDAAEKEGGHIEERRLVEGQSTLDDTKFSQYQLPGGENYKELLLTLPTKSDIRLSDSDINEVNKRLKASGGHMLEDEQYDILKNGGSQAKEMIEDFDARLGIKMDDIISKITAGGTAFRSSHFDEPNVLAHVRFNERLEAPSAGGFHSPKRILFIEELQSDMHQEGRKHGYYEPGTDETARAIRAVPNAPFKKTWHELALKRMLRYAAENGYDKIAWTTGEQQAERYDLSKQIESITASKKKNGLYHLNFSTINDQHIPNKTDVRPEELSNIVGKDLAEKIINQTELAKTYSGVDLKVGGEGMKGFYDQIIPAFLNKYTKKWGGRVSESEMTVPIPAFAKEFDKRSRTGSGFKVHSLELTPSMKESVMAGQPLFSRGKGAGMQKAAVESVVKSFADKMKNLPGITVVQSVEDAREIYGRTPDDAEGFFDPKSEQVVLIADNLADENRAKFVIAHETVGHFGLNGLLGKEKLADVMGQIYDTNEEVKKIADEKMAADSSLSREVATEEALADMANDAQHVGVIRRVIAVIRQALRDLGLEIDFSDADIQALLANSRRFVEQGDNALDMPAEDVSTLTEAFGANAAPVFDDLQRISETQEYQEKAQRVAELQGIIDQVKAKIEAASDVGKIRIKRFKGGYLSEELRAVPQKYFTTDPNAQTLDEVADEWGVSLDEAISILKDNRITREDITKAANARAELKDIEAEMRRKNPEIKAAVDKITAKSPKLKLSQSQIIKRLYQARFKGQKEGFREGREAGRQEVMSAKKILERRRDRVKGLAEMLNLSDADMKRINRRDIRLMSNLEFKQFIDRLEARAAHLAVKREIKNRVLFEIQDKRLKGVQNLQQALKMPPIDKMTVDQLRKLEEILSQAQADDEYLSTRKLETIQNTELAGIKTMREAREVLSKKMGVDLKSLEGIDYSPIDKLRWDAVLAEQNPFYKLLVDETTMSLMNSEQEFLRQEEDIDKLANAARKSRGMSFSDRIAPTDPNVAKWLETADDKKAPIEKMMTPQELAFAKYVKTGLEQFRDYLIKQEVLKHYIQNYLPHIRRGFFEAWKSDNVMEAFKEMFEAQKNEAEIAQILDEDTQNILPLEKYFPFSKRRSGNLKPSQNVAKAYKTYAKAILKKQALDRITPALDTYAHALSPRQMTPRGLQMNRKLVQFTREWINNKKGRKSSMGGLIPQGGKIDTALRSIDAVITFIDLGLNIPVGATVAVGENVVSYVNLGAKKYTLGNARLATPKGQEIAKKYESFTGKSPWRELANTADGLGDKFHKALFILFEASSVRANKVHLLGSMTKAEYDAGEIDPQRLAEMKREIARYRTTSNSKSIFGSTSTGGALTKYKTWAIPILRTTVKNVETLTKMLGKGDVVKASQSREFQELFRSTLITTAAALAARGLIADDDNDQSLLGEIIRKAFREAMSVLGAIDPTVLSSVRLTSFLGDLSQSIKMIVMLERYRTREGLKGVEKLKKTVVPRAARRLLKNDNGGGRKLS